MPHAFISHGSACEAIRVSGVGYVRWPEQSRMLPTRGDCVCSQRLFSQVATDARIEELGIVTRPVDILVPTSAMRRKGKQARMHEWSLVFPARSFMRMRSNVLVSTPEFALLQLSNVHGSVAQAYDKTYERYVQDSDALSRLGIDESPPLVDFRAWNKLAHTVCVARLLMEFAGTYRLPVGNQEKVRYHEPRVTSTKETEAFVAELEITCPFSRYSGAPSALRRACAWAMDGSASPMESALALMLSLPPEVGGYGFPKPELNVSRLSEQEGLLPDLLWRDRKIVVEYNSNEFHAGLGPHKTDADIQRANRLRGAGFTVFEVTPALVINARRLDELARQLGCVLGEDVDEPDEVVRTRRSLLHRELFFRHSSSRLRS